MNWPQECAVVIPCRNEGATLGELLTAISTMLPAIIVVDDGSTDDTADKANAGGARVISLPRAQGKGAALQAGWKQARALGFKWVLCMDGDGQHASTDIPKFLQCAQETGASLVIGNRMGDASKMPLVRRWVNRWMSRSISAMAGRLVPDSQCGFRLMRLAALDSVDLSAAHFEIESEQVVAFLAAGQRVEFVPVQVIYKSERSKIHPWRDTMRWFRWRRHWLACRTAPNASRREPASRTREEDPLDSR
jgi:glycosyltransferase involved in cell wall biosynthesis